VFSKVDNKFRHVARLWTFHTQKADSPVPKTQKERTSGVLVNEVGEAAGVLEG
jgi:hypothetical protein